MEKQIKTIGVLTSGGDAPGMNAAIRGVVRSALTEGLEVMGIYDGYLGLYEDRMVQLDRYSVSDMINRGGTFLGSARFPEFRDENIRAVAIENLKKQIAVLHAEYIYSYLSKLDISIEERKNIIRGIREALI